MMRKKLFPQSTDLSLCKLQTPVKLDVLQLLAELLNFVKYMLTYILLKQYSKHFLHISSSHSYIIRY